MQELLFFTNKDLPLLAIDSSRFVHLDSTLLFVSAMKKETNGTAKEITLPLLQGIQIVVYD